MLGIGAAVALIATVISLTIFFEDVANNELSSTTLFRLRVGLGAIVTSAAISAYHLLVYRHDRTTPAPSQPSTEPEQTVHGLVIVDDATRAQVILDEPDGPAAVLVTRNGDVDIIPLLEEALGRLRSSRDR